MKHDNIYIALKNVHQLTGIEAFWDEDGPLDGRLRFRCNNQEYNFAAEIKGELRTHQLQQIDAHFNHHENYILLANRIFPKIKEELRLKEVPYVEANGNIFLKKEGLFLFIDTQKAIKVEKNTGNRAFTKTGLKVLFYLLQNKDAINLTQRELAEKTDVALGNIPQIIDGLKETGYLIPLNNKAYVWENRKELLDRWVAEYASVLRPKLKKGRYTLREHWQDIAFNQHLTVWGGEPAADIITNYLRPEKFLIYTRENRMDLIKGYSFMPNDKGEVEVLEMFWKPKHGKTAPPLLVYADLLLEGSKRNKETAEKIYHDHILPNL